MAEFSNYMSPGRKGYLIGIGGVSMSSLAEVLLGMGITVCGSDSNRSRNVTSLEAKGIHIEIGHRAENIPADTDFVVRTAAVRDENPEIIQARAMNIPVFERTEAWGAISRDYSNAICISGTHGNAGHRVGHGNVIVMEACEYYNSFLSFHPTIAVILNIEADHLDFFKDLYDVEKSFRAFASRVPQDGYVVANYDDLNTMQTLMNLDRKMITFGLNKKADVHAENIEYIGANSHFDIIYKGRRFTDVTLHVPGEHNIKNALAATAAAICLGIRPYAVKYGLAGFNGAGRRFEFKGKFNGADVYDDYAHHPGELKCLLDTVETLNYKRTVLVFQPHTYSRTAALFKDFVAQLKRPDVLFLAEIFAAREQNTIGISSSALADQIDGARFFPSFEELEKSLRETLEPGDIILTVGAGDVYKIGEHLVEEA